MPFRVFHIALPKGERRGSTRVWQQEFAEEEVKGRKEDRKQFVLKGENVKSSGHFIQVGEKDVYLPYILRITFGYMNICRKKNEISIYSCIIKLPWVLCLLEYWDISFFFSLPNNIQKLKNPDFLGEFEIKKSVLVLLKFGPSAVYAIFKNCVFSLLKIAESVCIIPTQHHYHHLIIS